MLALKFAILNEKDQLLDTEQLLVITNNITCNYTELAGTHLELFTSFCQQELLY